uniref:KRAB-related domain-containing protein n=1 Tax=Pipistrellus kuhlii TaxID=59472 RepID=A0A7J7T1Y1_PIPKU|nr:hypothetical protein mPipKuh1_016716 [Pipistrellus kuhlii]
MSRDSSLDNNPMEDSQDSQETREQLEKVPKCFTEEEWTKLDNADKLTYVYMKKRYDFMTALGLMAVGPHSLLPNKGIPKSPDQGLDETQNPGHHESRKEETTWRGRLRERTDQIVYREISDQEEDD